MMTEPVYFLVEHVHGRECSSFVYDGLPRKYAGARDDRKKRARGWVYSQRIDDQPHLAGRTRQELHDLWLANGRKLPPASAPPLVVEVLKHCDECAEPERCAAERACLKPENPSAARFAEKRPEGPRAYWLPRRPQDWPSL